MSSGTLFQALFFSICISNLVNWREMRFFPIFCQIMIKCWGTLMPMGYICPVNGTDEPSLPLQLVSWDGYLREPDTPHSLFFTAMERTALQSICRLHSSGDKLSWCLYLVLIVEGGLLCLTNLFDILNLPKTDGTLCSSTLANWRMPFYNL